MPFDLELLPEWDGSANDIYAYIKKHIKEKSLTYLQLEFLFAEMIRRLKALDREKKWTRIKSKSTSTELSKNRICRTIYKELLLPGVSGEIPGRLILQTVSQTKLF